MVATRRFKQSLSILLIAILVITLAPLSVAYAAPDPTGLTPGEDYVEGELIISFDDDATEAEINEVIKSCGATANRVYISPYVKYAFVSFDKTIPIAEMIERFENDPSVIAADLNLIGSADPVVKSIWERIGGDTRYDTMSNISKVAFDNCTTVIVTTGAKFPDALSGAALAGINDCPIILTEGSALSPQAASEIERLGAQEVIILGGTASVSAEVQAELEALDGVEKVSRIEGADRYEVSLSIYEAGKGEWSDTLIVATGIKPTDALSLSPYAYKTGSPIFLVDATGALSHDMRAKIAGSAFEKAIIAGGPASVSNEIQEWFEGVFGRENVSRINGVDRYEASANAAAWLTGENIYSIDSKGAYVEMFSPSTKFSYDYMAVASGGDTKFADALSGSTLCGSNVSVLMLIDDSEAGRYGIEHNIDLKRVYINHGYILGGPATISLDLENGAKVRRDLANHRPGYDYSETNLFINFGAGVTRGQIINAVEECGATVTHLYFDENPSFASVSFDEDIPIITMIERFEANPLVRLVELSWISHSFGEEGFAETP